MSRSLNLRSTPTIPFILPIQSDLVTNAIVTFRQKGENLLDKKLNETGVSIVDDNLIVRLTETETSLFSENYNLFIQVKLQIGESVFVSRPIVLDVYNTYNTELFDDSSELTSNLSFGTIKLNFNEDVK